MKPQKWWQPGSPGGMLSRRWAQVYVFPLPNLKPSELEASLRYKVQSLLPSSDLPLRTRLVRHAGKLFGVVIVDRLPETHPNQKALSLGMPLILPSSWASECLLAVASPEGWELHGYVNRILTVSNPPVQTGSPTVTKILSQYSDQPVYWIAPDPSCLPDAPEWAIPAPSWKSDSWGLPWEAPKESRWQWVLGGLLLVVGLAAWILVGSSILQSKLERNQHWETWLKTARTLAGAPNLSAQKLAQQNAKAGEPMEEVLTVLAKAWSTGVEIRRLEIGDGKVSLTARAPSALSAVASLTKEPKGENYRVLQIRPVAGGEEFDLEGRIP